VARTKIIMDLSELNDINMNFKNILDICRTSEKSLAENTDL